MKVVIDLSKDLHPIGQLVLFLLKEKRFEDIHRLFPVNYQKYIASLIKQGYVLNEEKEEIDLAKLILNKSKLKKIFGEIESSNGWIDEYRELFKGKKSGAMGSRTACVKKMDKFIQEFGFSKETILHATRRYINKTKDGGYNYLQQADYFIYKNEIVAGSSIEHSRLSTFCEEVDMLDKEEISDDPWNRQLI